MQTGYQGTFVISWAQTELDGARAAPPSALCVGAVWRWWGEAVRVDGSADILLLQDAAGSAERRARAARMARRLMGAALTGRDIALLPDEDRAPQQSFTLTDGHKTYAASVIAVRGTPARLVMFADGLPPRDADLWIVSSAFDPATGGADPESAAGVICFTPGTWIRTPNGPSLIDRVRPGDMICTKDNGPQQVLWTGRRRISGARLHAMPDLRPVRIRAGAMGEDRPEGDLIVSPGHRMLVEGRASRALFAQAEVLVAARDLVNGSSIHVERGLAEVTYIHLMTEHHQVVWANGLETESFHPANADLSLIDPGQRGVLLALMPELEGDPLRYGPYARRNLTAPEAAILRRDAA
jgi:Hint domain